MEEAVCDARSLVASNSTKHGRATSSLLQSVCFHIWDIHVGEIICFLICALAYVFTCISKCVCVCVRVRCFRIDRTQPSVKTAFFHPANQSSLPLDHFLSSSALHFLPLVCQNLSLSTKSRPGSMAKPLSSCQSHTGHTHTRSQETGFSPLAEVHAI